jgi:flagellar hook-associated protein 1 FlgK
LTLTQNFNDQHKLGMDLAGILGVDFFDVSNQAPTVRGNTANSDVVANTGSPTVTLDGATISQLTDSDYRLSTDGTNFTLTRLSDNSTTAITTVPQVVDGLSIDTSTWNLSLVAGDSFLIQPTRTGARNISMAFSDARLIAAAAPVRTSAALTNTGTASISSATVDTLVPPAVLDPNLQNRVTITFIDATHFDVVDTTNGANVLPSNVLYTTGSDISYNGWTMQISGRPTVGDVFTVSVNSNGVSDNRNAMLLGTLQASSTMIGSAAGPTASYQSAYSQIVSSVGSKTNEVAAIGASQQTLANHATNSLQQISGVNLDEEAANMLRYQQAYQASAKILATAAKVFEEILALGR